MLSNGYNRYAEEHARRIAASQPKGTVAIGGHSLGGLLAVESAMLLEAGMGRDVACYLFDAPHPVQFKADWNDVPGEGDEAGAGAGAKEAGAGAGDDGESEGSTTLGGGKKTSPFKDDDAAEVDAEEEEEGESTGLAYMVGLYKLNPVYP
jgi:hypothetical protein